MPRKRALEPQHDAVDVMVEVGRAVYGSQWQRPLGRALAVSGQLVQAVAARRLPMSDDLKLRLGEWSIEERSRQRALLAERLDALSRAEAVLLAIPGDR